MLNIDILVAKTQVKLLTAWKPIFEGQMLNRKESSLFQRLATKGEGGLRSKAQLFLLTKWTKLLKESFRDATGGGSGLHTEQLSQLWQSSWNWPCSGLIWSSWWFKYSYFSVPGSVYSHFFEASSWYCGSLGVLVAQLCPTLCNPMDCSPPGSSVPEIFQARILEWVAISFSRGSSQPRDRTQASCTAGRFFTNWATREAHCGSLGYG